MLIPKVPQMFTARSRTAAEKLRPPVDRRSRHALRAGSRGCCSREDASDAFFEAVQVNADNAVLRRNRLNLLSRIREAGRLVADFGRIEG